MFIQCSGEEWGEYGSATVAALSHDCPNIIAVKEASGRFDQATAILKSKRADFAALSGEDALLLPLMSLGFEGVISVIANVLPNDYACLVKSAFQGDYPTARRIHLDRAELCKALFEEVSNITKSEEVDFHIAIKQNPSMNIVSPRNNKNYEFFC